MRRWRWRRGMRAGRGWLSWRRRWRRWGGSWRGGGRGRCWGVRRGAGQGVVEGRLGLAAMYAGGSGGAGDAQAGARWEQTAADAGRAVGCLRVAERALAQPGGAGRALPWLIRAADAGSAEAAA